MSALATDKGEKPKCPTCKKPHSAKCLAVHNTVALKNPDENVCPVCEEDAHTYKTKAGKEVISKRVKDCPSFKAAGEDEKQALIKKLKVKLPICGKCSGWTHKTEACN